MSNKEITRRQFVIGTSAMSAAVVAGLAGCTSSSSSSAASASASASASSASASASSASASASASSAAAAKTQKITDLRGAEVEVPTEINKIVDLWHAHCQVILMLGAGDKLIGTTDIFKKRPWANVAYPRLSEVEALVLGSGAGEVNYEECLKLEPDVVFASDNNVTETARSKGLTTVNVAFQDYDGLRADVALTGKILGGEAEERAEAWKKILDENIALVEERMIGVAIDKRTRVLHIANANNFTKVDGINCIVDEWIKLAGGQNALTVDGNLTDVTMEDIVASDPDMIIIGSANAEACAKLMADEAWTGLKAVQNGAVYANPSGVFAWDRYSGEEALQVLWAAKLLNPEVFADINIEQETKDFYKLFYGCELTDDQVTRILTGENPA